MIKHYGYPNNILTIDKLVIESKSEDLEESGFMQNLAKKIYSMKEVSFHNNPQTVVWNKGVYHIHMNFFYDEKGTQLVFNKIKN